MPTKLSKFALLFVFVLLLCAEPRTTTAATAATGGHWAAIDAGDINTCALRTDKKVTCWGYGGNGSAHLADQDFKQVSAGRYYACAIKTTSTVACWGENQYGEATPPGGTFTQLDAGYSNTCGVKTDGTLECWGYEGVGVNDPPPGTFRQVSTGNGHACAVKSDATLECWGYNGTGQATAPPGTFKQVSAWNQFTCAVQTDGTLECWGLNHAGQASPPDGTFTQVSTGFEFACGLKTDGSVECWGYESEGSTTPPVGTFVQLSVGGYHACAITPDNEFKCWGSSSHYQTQAVFIRAEPFIPTGVVGKPYDAFFEAWGGTAPYTITLLEGNLPPGLQLDVDGGVSGTPTTSGTFDFTLHAEDANFLEGSRQFEIYVCPNPLPKTKLQEPKNGAQVTESPWLRWKPVPCVGMFKGQVKDLTTGERFKFKAFSLSHVIPPNKLQAGHTYEWSVQACNSYISSNCGKRSKTRTFTMVP